jgi:hypothetical protein
MEVLDVHGKVYKLSDADDIVEPGDYLCDVKGNIIRAVVEDALVDQDALVVDAVVDNVDVDDVDVDVDVVVDKSDANCIRLVKMG